MEKVGTDAFISDRVCVEIRTEQGQGEITWTPVKGVGNAQEVSGIWNGTDKGNSTLVVLETGGDMDIPLPGLMKMVVGPVVKSG